MIGSGMNGELTALDILNVLSFIIGLKNLDLNIDQNDMDNQTREIDERANRLVDVRAITTPAKNYMKGINEKIENYQETFKND